MDLLMVVLGWLAHHLKVMSDMSKAGGKYVSPLNYVKSRPYKFTLSIVGTAMGVIFLLFTAHPTINPSITYGIWLGLLAGVGFAGDLVADKFGSMATKKMQ